MQFVFCFRILWIFFLQIFETSIFPLKYPLWCYWGEKTTFLCLLDAANIQCAGDIFVNHSKRQIKNCGVLLQVNRLWAETGPGL